MTRWLTNVALLTLASVLSRPLALALMGWPRFLFTGWLGPAWSELWFDALLGGLAGVAATLPGSVVRTMQENFAKFGLEMPKANARRLDRIAFAVALAAVSLLNFSLLYVILRTDF